VLQESCNVKIAVPRSGETIAPCFEYCSLLAIFTVENGQISDQLDFPLKSRLPFDRIRLVRDQQVDTVICGGIQDFYEDLLKTHRVEVVSWVNGNVETLIQEYLKGMLKAGSGRLGVSAGDCA